jgi:hypothetical protein
MNKSRSEGFRSKLTEPIPDQGLTKEIEVDFTGFEPESLVGLGPPEIKL